MPSDEELLVFWTMPRPLTAPWERDTKSHKILSPAPTTLPCLAWSGCFINRETGLRIRVGSHLHGNVWRLFSEGHCVLVGRGDGKGPS